MKTQSLIGWITSSLCLLFMLFLISQDVETIDWREFGVITGVKNQLNCAQGSWVFGVTGAIEGLMGISQLTGSLETNQSSAKVLRLSETKSRLACLKAASQSQNYLQVALSEQQILDCTPYSDNCTTGGNLSDAYSFAQVYGIVSDLTLYYVGRKEICPIAQKSLSAFNITGYQLDSGCPALNSAIFNQPITVKINFSGLVDYFVGEDEKDTAIITQNMCNNEDTSNSRNQGEMYQYVLVVGYDGSTYTIKNSMGRTWGYHGYARIDATELNVCGICNEIAYPLSNNP